MKRIAALALATLLAGCAYTYPVKEAGDGVYYAESPPEYTYIDSYFYDPFLYPYWYATFYHPSYPWLYDEYRYPYSAKSPYRSPSEVRPGRPAPSVPLVYRDYPMTAAGYAGHPDAWSRRNEKMQFSRGTTKPSGFGAPAKRASRSAYTSKNGAPSAAGSSRPMRAAPPRAPRAAASRPAVRSSAPARSSHKN